MASSKAKTEEIAQLLSAAGDIRTRSMMGEYLLYVDDVLVGQVNNDELFIKVTAFGDTQLSAEHKVSPYPGAKPAFKIPAAKLGNPEWLTDFVRGSRAALAPQR